MTTHGALFLIGVGATWVGGMGYLLGTISGTFPLWSYTGIDRHDDPDRFQFWHRLSAILFIIGVALLVARWTLS